MEFKIAMTDTPTSANTASHILAIPNAPSISTIAFYTKCKYDILVHDGKCLSCNLHKRCNLSHIIIHKNYICSFNGCIGTHTSHCNSNVCSGQYRCIVDSITHKCKFFLSHAVLSEVPQPDLLCHPAVILHALHPVPVHLLLPVLLPYGLRSA